MPKLEKWGLIRSNGCYDAPELQTFHLLGKVYNHPFFEDGATVKTSAVVKCKNGKVITESGSEYKLGKADPDYEKFYPNAKERIMKQLGAKKRAVKYEIVNLGPDHPDYFTGFGTFFTDFDYSTYGVGMNAKEAYNDALDMLYQQVDEEVELDSLEKLLPKQPKGIRKSDRVLKKEEENGIYWHVGIRIKVK